MDIHNSIIDLHNLVMDIHHSIMDSYKSAALMNLHDSYLWKSEIRIMEIAVAPQMFIWFGI